MHPVDARGGMGVQVGHGNTQIIYAYNQAERDFLRACHRARRHSMRWREAAIAGLAALTVAAATSAVVAARIAEIAASEATSTARQHAIALSRQLAAESLAVDPADPLTARRLAIAAWRVSQTSQAGSALASLAAGQSQEGVRRCAPMPARPRARNGSGTHRAGRFPRPARERFPSPAVGGEGRCGWGPESFCIGGKGLALCGALGSLVG